VNRLFLVAVCFMAGLTAVAPAQSQGPEQPAFQLTVDVVSLNITVVNSSARYLTGLDQSDFSVFEDGIKQDIIFFSRRAQPIALSLLLDSSTSMKDKLGTLQVAAANFVHRLKPNDIAQVIDFDSRVTVRQPFTPNQSKLEAGIRQAVSGGSTSLHNALYVSLKELAKIRVQNEEEIRRQALIVFSDGEDTSSLISFEEVLDLAKRSEASIYTISLRETGNKAVGFREAEFILRQLAQETGGRGFFPTRIEDLRGVYTQIADELASQYTVGYTSKNLRNDGAFRRIVVQVAEEDATPRTKRGYYAPAH